MSCNIISKSITRRCIGQSIKGLSRSHVPTSTVPILHCVSTDSQFLVHRRAFHVTAMDMEKHTIKVPTMGDSISEGTIVEWVAQVGQAVQPDDVIVLVETDKVTIDIKAEKEGVVTSHFGAVDETVEVGADLYELDTEGTATVTASDAADSPAQAETEEKPVAAAKESPDTAAPAASTSSGTRVPSIKFLGKQGWTQRLTHSSADDNASEGSTDSPVIYGDLPFNYGRPAFTEAEMDALVSGGANLVPEVRKLSGGALFGY